MALMEGDRCPFSWANCWEIAEALFSPSMWPVISQSPGAARVYNFRQIYSSPLRSEGPNKTGIVAEPGAPSKKTTPRNPNTCRAGYFPAAYSLQGQVAKPRQLRARRFPGIFLFEKQTRVNPSSQEQYGVSSSALSGPGSFLGFNCY